jgi:hypothetical protein
VIQTFTLYNILNNISNHLCSQFFPQECTLLGLLSTHHNNNETTSNIGV